MTVGELKRLLDTVEDSVKVVLQSEDEREYLNFDIAELRDVELGTVALKGKNPYRTVSHG